MKRIVFIAFIFIFCAADKLLDPSEVQAFLAGRWEHTDTNHFEHVLNFTSGVATYQFFNPLTSRLIRGDYTVEDHETILIQITQSNMGGFDTGCMYTWIIETINEDSMSIDLQPDDVSTPYRTFHKVI